MTKNREQGTTLLSIFRSTQGDQFQYFTNLGDLTSLIAMNLHEYPILDTNALYELSPIIDDMEGRGDNPNDVLPYQVFSTHSQAGTTTLETKLCNVLDTSYENLFDMQTMKNSPSPEFLKRMESKKNMKEKYVLQDFENHFNGVAYSERKCVRKEDGHILQQPKLDPIPYLSYQNHPSIGFSDNAYDIDTYVAHPDDYKMDLDHNASKELFRFNLWDITMKPKYPMLESSLSKPAFHPSHKHKDGMYAVVGTDEQDMISENHLIFFHFNVDGMREMERKPLSERSKEPQYMVWTQKISDCVRDIRWIDDENLLFAQGSSIGLARLGVDYNLPEMIEFPTWHQDHIREMDIKNFKWVLTGGFDGKLAVTDIVQLSHDMNRRQMNLNTYTYFTQDIIGSVRWHPQNDYLASFTLDSGSFSIIDTRNPKETVLTFKSEIPDMYTHEYTDSYQVLLGYGDGTIQFFDTRYPGVKHTFKDSHVNAIGDILYNRESGLFGVWGIPGFSMWKREHELEATNVFNSQKHFNHDISLKYSGDFIPNTQYLGCTNNLGEFALYQL